VRVLIASTFVPFIEGGGTKIVDDLHREMKARGIDSDVVLLPLYSAWDEIAEQTLAFRLLDVTESAGNRIDRLITIRYPSYALRHPSKVAWFIHHHREAYDLWGTKWGGMPENAVGRHYRNMMHRSDDIYLRECQRIYTNSAVVADRLQKFSGLTADRVLYPPLASGHPFRPSRESGDYIFYPSRITRIKRQDLAIRAMPHTPHKLRLVIAGTGDVEGSVDELRVLATELGVLDRVEFTGWISEERKAELMAGCVGCLYLAFDEDSYGYVTLEAFHSAKPVITLTDSGGSLEVVRDGKNGFVCEPTPVALGDAMSRLWARPSVARTMGERAHKTIEEFRIDWDHVLENLLS